MGCAARHRGRRRLLGRAMRLLRRLLPVVAITVLCAVLPSMAGDPHTARGPASPTAQLGQLITPVALGVLAVAFGVFELGVLRVGSGPARRGAGPEGTAARRYEAGCGEAERMRVWPGG